MTMHKWLKDAQAQNVRDLHAYWHECMEPVGDRGDRNRFFSEVIKLANSASHSLFFLFGFSLTFLAVEI